MSSQSLLQSFDALGVSGDVPSHMRSEGSHVRELYSSGQSAPLDAPVSFSPFNQPHALPPHPNAAQGHSSRFQHLFGSGTSNTSRELPHSHEEAFSPSSSESGPLDGHAMRNSAPLYASSWNAPSPGTSLPYGSDAAPSLQIGSGPIRFGGQLPSPVSDSDVIPTAIVIKNIPFNIKREQLLHVIRDLGIPVPYAFNYHFDHGIFRGLAFANFHSPTEAGEVVNALNGLDVSGRKLRVEYKKVLQAGEKERIEKEKAIKRMHSATHVDKDRRKEKSPMDLSGLPSMPQRAASPGFAVHRYSPTPAGSAHKEGNKPPFEAGGTSFYPRGQDDTPLDLNDASTLEIYSRVLLFKDDRMRDELAFSRTLSVQERHTVHLVAQKLGLFHYTVGHPDECHVLVTKFEQPQHGASGESRESHANPMHVSADRSARVDMRGKKSAPDLKRTGHVERDTFFETDHASPGQPRDGLYVQAPLYQRASQQNLRDKPPHGADRRFEAFGHFGPPTPAPVAGTNIFASPFDIPVMPHILRASSANSDRSERFHPTSAPHRARSPLSHSGTYALPQPQPAITHNTSFMPGGAGLPHRPNPTRNVPVDLAHDPSATNKPRPRIPYMPQPASFDAGRAMRKQGEP